LSSYADSNSLINLKGALDYNVKTFKDVLALGNFIGNHDNSRWLSRNNDVNRMMNAAAFILFIEGIPIWY